MSTPEHNPVMRRPSQPTLCLVCGFDYDGRGGLPWGESGEDPSYNYCICCGVEFGYGDSSLSGARRWRDRWRADGFPWDRPDERPRDWDPEEQLGRLPEWAH